MFRKTSLKAVKVGVCLVASGCQLPLDEHPFARWITDGEQHFELASNNPSTAGRSLPSYSGQHPGDVAQPIPPGSGAEDYVRLALQRNPEIRAAQRKAERLEQRIVQVTSLSDPTLMVSGGEMAETAAGQVDFIAGISQKLPMPGKLATRGRIAAQDVAAATAELEQTKLRVAGDVRRAYWNYFFATRAIEVTQQSRGLLEQFMRIAESKLKAGVATQQDALRASVELGNLDKELIQYQQMRATATAMLNSLLDRPMVADLPSPPKMELSAVSLQLDALLSEAAQVNPQIQEVRAHFEAFRQRLELARLDYWPDLTIGFNYAAVGGDGLSRVANGDDQWSVGVGVNVPIWQQPRRAAEREAIQGIGESVGRLQQAHNSVAFRVRDSLTRVESQQKLVLLFRDQILLEASQTVDVSITGYRAGNLDFLTLIDNWRKLLQFELMQQQNLARLEQAFADLCQAVGRDIPRAHPDSAALRGAGGAARKAGGFQHASNQQENLP